MPRWPGPVLIIGGAIVGMLALSVGTLAVTDQLPGPDPSVLAWIALAGGLAFVAGLVYVAVRQIRVRRFLPPERYRGPSVLVLLVLALVVSSFLTAPFAADAAIILGNPGELTLFGSIVILVATQAALLVVTWLFVVRPDALAGLARFPGPDPAGALRLGIGAGLAAWFGASLVALLWAAGLRALGIDADPQTGELALSVVDPVLAVVAIVVLAPLAEEVFFRGVVFNALRREGGRRWAYLGSAALFAAIHLSLVALLPIFLLGLALAWVYERTGSLLAPIAMHAVVNGASVLIAMLVRFEVVGLPA